MRTLITIIVAAALLSATPGTAHAADELGVSRDGTTWSASLTEPLFDSGVRWVPGDLESRDFLVRNTSDEPGALEVEILGTSDDSLLETGDLSVSARIGAGEWRSVSEPGTRQLAASTLAAGTRERVSVRVALDPASGNVSQRKEHDLQLRVQLTQDGVAPIDDGDDAVADDPADAGPEADAATSEGFLPDTGSPRGLAMAALVGAALVLVGLLLGRRRREAGHG